MSTPPTRARCAGCAGSGMRRSTGRGNSGPEQWCRRWSGEHERTHPAVPALAVGGGAARSDQRRYRGDRGHHWHGRRGRSRSDGNRHRRGRRRPWRGRRRSHWRSHPRQHWPGRAAWRSHWRRDWWIWLSSGSRYWARNHSRRCAGRRGRGCSRRLGDRREPADRRADRRGRRVACRRNRRPVDRGEQHVGWCLGSR